MVAVKLIKTDLGKNFEKAIKDLNTKVGKVGWNQTARYTNVTSNIGPIRPVQVAQVAYWNEMGNPSHNVPARPFIKPTIIEKLDSWRNIATIKSRQVILGKSTATDLMETLGQKAAADITKTIENLWSPALSPSTIRARISKYTSDSDLKESTRKRRKKEVKRFVAIGLYKPLEDTGHMLDTLINVVEDA